MASLRTRMLVISVLVCLGACTAEDDAAGGGTDGAALPGPPWGDAATLPGPDGSVPPVVPPTTPWLDASVVQPDGGARADAGALDAALPDAALPDAALPDAALPDAALPDASTPTGAVGVCGGATPHGCYKAKAGNDRNCPAQMPEQSGFYPPMSEWKGCSSPLYQACVYLRPDGSEANCSCDFGLHWLCTY